MKLSTSKLLWSGVVLLIAGPAIFLGRWAWIQTRTDRPVDIPVSLKPGKVHISGFRINHNWPFSLVVSVKSIGIDRHLECLLGCDIPSDHCTESAVVHAHWVLSSRGKVLSSGEDNNHLDLGGSDGISEFRKLGQFDLEAGRRYDLDVLFSSDGSALASFDPHLRIQAYDGGFYEDEWFRLLLVFLPIGVSVDALGIVLVSIWLIRKHKSRQVARTSVPKSHHEG